MKEDLSEKQQRFEAAAAGPLMALPPAVQARRRRLIRILGVVTVLATLGLSALPESNRIKSRSTYHTGSGASERTTTIVTYDRAFGRPFNVATGEVGDRQL